MPIHKRIREGDPVPTPQTAEALGARIIELEAIVLDFQKIRYKARKELAPAKKWEVLEKTHEPFDAALKELAQVQKDLYRMINGGTAGQTVAVGTASESEGR